MRSLHDRHYITVICTLLSSLGTCAIQYIFLPTTTAMNTTSEAILHEMKPKHFLILDFIEYKIIFTSMYVFNVTKPIQLSS